MSARTLLAELAAAGVRLSLAGDGLRFQTKPGVAIAPFADRIRANKPALVARLRKREPVEATSPPEDWDGFAPIDCARPTICQTLGPCPHVVEHGRCWKGGVS